MVCATEYRAEIWWRTPCRGGYHPPGCFPVGKTTSAQSADNAVRIFVNKIRREKCRNAPTRSVPLNDRAEISGRCRGGYHPPGCFPFGETTSAQCADNVIRIFFIKIPGHNDEMWYICNIVTLPGQCGSAQKFATLAGGYYPPLHGVSFKISFFTEMRFAFSADNGSTKLKRIYKVLKDTLY